MNENTGFLHSLVIDTEQCRAENMVATLFVPGGVVSGVMISTKQYVARRNEALNIEMTTEVCDELEEMSQLNATNPHLVLLDDTKLISGGNLIHLGLWRGRLDMIAGYSFGRFNLPDKP